MRRLKPIGLALTLLICSVPIHAQEQWKKIAPLGEPYTVLMPTFAHNVSRLIPLSETDSLPTRVLYSVSTGRRYAIVSFVRGQTPTLSNFPEFVLAMEWSLTKGEGARGSVTFDEDFSEGSRIVKQYKLQLGEYKGVARFIAADDSFYAMVVTGADANDSDARRFLESFTLGKTNDDDEPSVTKVITKSGAYADHQQPPEPWPRAFSTPISGGVLNDKAESLAKPEYPEAARKNRDAGQVRVQIVIDEFGRVISAVALSGPRTLRKEAVRVALKSRFTPTRLSGQPVKVTGVIIYTFAAQ